MPEPISITGCRPNVLGHALKALGILRALNVCAAEGHADPDAEAWWDTGAGIFRLLSPKYPTETALAEFFAEHYRPTPIFSPWNTGGGLDEKMEMTFRLCRRPVASFLRQNRKTLRAAGMRPGTRWEKGALQFDLARGAELPSLELPEELVIETERTATKRPKQKVRIHWRLSHEKKLAEFLRRNIEGLVAAGLSKNTRERAEKGEPLGEDITLTIKDRAVLAGVAVPSCIEQIARVKTSGKKAVIARVESSFSDEGIVSALRLAREHFDRFMETEGSREFRDAAAAYRDRLSDPAAKALDSVFTTHTRAVGDNPAFLNRGCGEGDNSELFRSFWNCVLAFLKNPEPQIQTALYAQAGSALRKEKAPGTPFFPDLIKTYNNGLAWVLETFPFCALDYVLAVEGALAFRGSAARLLAVRSGNFAAFPFVFETAEEMTDEKGDVKGTALSLWLPIWNRPVTFAELESFILDSQARLPGREARFTAEFERAIRVQGVDAGFAGYQEFRFKMKGARGPWVCTGRYLAAGGTQTMTGAAELLRPLDETGFLDQFQIEGKDGRTHRHLLAGILDAIEDATSEREPHRYLTVLEQVFEVTRRLAVSKRFREVVKSPTFPPPLPPEPWLEALGGLETEPEFEIARAVASIVGHEGQQDGTWSAAEPLLGSILPLKLGRNAWYLPESPSAQAGWSGADLSLDLARALARRYQDSRDDDRPALASACSARLSTVLRFLYGELDDARIARYTEALSLIGWRFGTAEVAAYSPHHDEAQRPIPLPYAAIRSLLEAELHPSDGMERRRCISVRALALLGEQSSAGMAAATVEALDRLRVAGVPNPYANRTESHKTSLAGRDIVHLERGELLVPEPLFRRVAAAVCIPLHWRDRFTLLRTITLPQTIQLEENA